MITIDITLFIHLVNIFFLIVIMNIVLYRPVRAILIARQKKTAELARDIETLNKNAAMRLEEFDRKLNDARKSAKNELEAGRSAAQGVSSEIQAKARQEVDGVKAEQMKSIEEQFATAQAQLKGQISTFANDMASKVLGRAVQ